jgi:hypothetical protein
MSLTNQLIDFIDRLSTPKEDPKYNTPFEVNGFIRNSGGIKRVKMIVKGGIIYEVTKIKIDKTVTYCDFDGDDGSYNQD